MTIDEMRAAVQLPEGATDAEVVVAFALLLDAGYDGMATPEPVTVDMVRTQCYIDDEIEGTLISQKIRAAREWVEDHTSVIIVRRMFAARFGGWGHPVTLFKRPIVSVDAIVAGGALVGDVTYALGAWPLQLTAPTGASAATPITIIYTAGFPEGVAPSKMIEAILVLVGGMLASREGAYQASLDAAAALLPRSANPVLA